MRSAPAVFAAVALVAIASTAFARGPDPASSTKQAVIDRCIAIYKESGHPCACPFDQAKNGACGRRSAHDRAGGATPVCFAAEVTPELEADFRGNAQAILRERCHYHF